MSEEITNDVPAVNDTEDAQELSIEELDGVSGGLSVSSLACAACPVSSFSSLAN